MDYIDIMSDFYGNEARIYEYGNGAVIVEFDDVLEIENKEFKSYDMAANWLYKKGFIF